MSRGAPLLPSLGALSLGAPTGAKDDVLTELKKDELEAEKGEWEVWHMEQRMREREAAGLDEWDDEHADSSGDESDDEPLDRRGERLRRRDAAEVAERQAAARETASLAGLPPEVIGTMVTQAALAARDTKEPASTICEWMKNFCRSAGNQGQKCDDQWYRLALAAFGFVPQGTVEGVQPSPPSDSAFTSWREFFGALCQAFHGREGLRMPQDQRRTGGQPNLEREGKLYVDPAMTQRMMDGRLNSLLFHKMLDWDTAKFPLDFVPYDEERGNQPTKAFYEHMEQLIHSSKAPWTALVLLLKMRGAVLPGLKWQRLDWDLYAIVVRRKRGELTPLEALNQARDVLDRGANPNASSSGYEAYRPGMPTVPEGWKREIIQLLLGVNRGPRFDPNFPQPFDPEDAALIELLVERGLKPSIRELGTDLLLRRTLAPDWTVDHKTTEKLLRHVLRQQVVSNNRMLRQKLSKYNERIIHYLVQDRYKEDEGIDDEIPPPTKVPNMSRWPAGHAIVRAENIEYRYNALQLLKEVNELNKDEYDLEGVVLRIRKALLEAGTSVPGWLRDLWTAQYETLLKTRERFEERLLELRWLFDQHFHKLQLRKHWDELHKHWAKLRQEPVLPWSQRRRNSVPVGPESSSDESD